MKNYFYPPPENFAPLTFIAFFLFLMFPVFNWAQVIPHYSKSEVVESYVETKRVFYTIPDGVTLEYLSNMEKINIRSEKTIQKVNVYESDHRVIREIVYQKPPSLPGWMTAPQKVILSDEGVCWGPLDGNGHPTRVYFTESNPAFCITHESPPDITDCLPVYNTQTVSYESDGVVVESSAKAFPGATQVKMIGSNHQQMRNDNQTRDALLDLFDGDHGNYFITPER